MAWVWCTYLPHLVHLLTFLSLLGYVSPSRVSLPCYGSFVAAREFGWSNGVFRQCMRGLCEELLHELWCTYLPHLVHLLTFLSLVGYVSHNTPPSHVMLSLTQLVSWLWQGLLLVAHARDITQERKKGLQVHKMGQVCAPHPCHNPSHNPRMHCRKTPFEQPNSRAATKEPKT